MDLTKKERQGNFCLVCSHTHLLGNLDVCRCERPILAPLNLVFRGLSVAAVRKLPQYRPEMERRNIIAPLKVDTNEVPDA